MSSRDVEERSSSRGQRTVLVAGLAVLGAALIAGAAIWATRQPREAQQPRAVVMPGHGQVMPTDVKAVARPDELKVMVGDYWLKSSALRLRAGRYTFIAQNVGVIPHDVMVERAPIKMSAPGQPVDGAAPFGVEGLVNGTTKRTTVTLDAGTWELFCSVPGHYEAGQHMTIQVTGKLPRGMRTPAAPVMGEQNTMGA